MFDPSTFLDATITEVQVKRPNLPAGADFVGEIGEVKITPWAKRDDPTKTGIKAEMPIKIDTSTVPGQPPTVTINYGIMLDLNESGTGIDFSPGKNTKLRQFREALGMNAPGAPFNWRAVQGKMIKVKISHRPYENELYDDIAGVAKA